MKKPSVRFTRHFKNPVALLLIIGCLVLVSFFLFINNDPQKVTTVPSTTQEEDIKSVQQGAPAKNSNSTSTSANSDKQGDDIQSTELSTPMGNFVSSHTISSPASTIESVCSTSIAATCEISFKMGDSVLTLDKKETDKNGTAIWTWTPDSIGITSGIWEITATAAKDGQTSTATDPMKLEVKI